VERGYPGTEFCVDIVVKGRKTEVPERFRKHVAEKLNLEKIQKLDGKVISLDVEVSKEPNPRQADRCDRVEITLHSRGPVIRAEAAASDAYAALDLAAEKLDAQLRKQHDKRYTRRGARRLGQALHHARPGALFPVRARAAPALGQIHARQLGLEARAQRIAVSRASRQRRVTDEQHARGGQRRGRGSGSRCRR